MNAQHEIAHLIAALREMVSAAEAAGWDVCRENAGILNAARDALAAAEGDA